MMFFNQAIRKYTDTKGETLVEALVALLIAVLSISLLSASVVASVNINAKNRALDESYNSQLQDAEGMRGTPKESKVKITYGYGSSTEVSVDVYGEDGAFISYRYEPEEEKP